MSAFSESLAVSASGLRAQAARLKHVSENIANADTPGYHRKTVSFEVLRDRFTDVGRVAVGNVQLDHTEPERIYDPSHPLADESGHYEGSNVNLMIEIADAREAQRSYEANLKLFDQARQMSSDLIDLLRKLRRSRMDVQNLAAARNYVSARSATGAVPGSQPQGTGAQAAFNDFAATLQNAEDTAIASMTGNVDPHALVQALAQTELAVETAVVVRDKVVEAYQEILRMPV